MQKQKEEIRNKILNAAEEEFVSVGYRQASMRKIAQRSGVTVGNIYAYFEGKDHLFAQVMAPTLEKISTLLWEISKGSSISENNIQKITSAVLQVYMQNRRGFLLLTDLSAGSEYNSVKGQLLEVVKQRLTDEFLPQVPPDRRSEILSGALAAAILEGVLCIFREHGEEEAQISRSVDDFITVMLIGMKAMTQEERKEG